MSAQEDSLPASPCPARNGIPRFPTSPQDDGFTAQTRTEPGSSSSMGFLSRLCPNGEFLPELVCAGMMGLLLIRNRVEELVDQERDRMMEIRHDSLTTIRQTRSRVKAEKDRLRYIERKLAEKRNSHQRALKEFDSAQSVLLGAKLDRGEAVAMELKLEGKPAVQICEALCKSLNDNISSAMLRVAAWDFKKRRQSAITERLTAELDTAEAGYIQACHVTEGKLDHLEAVKELLAQLE